MEVCAQKCTRFCTGKHRRMNWHFIFPMRKKGMKILEPLCGSGRFLVPFAQSGFWIQGVDNSAEMIEKLLQKLPSADVVQSDIEQYRTSERFDYIFISSGSVSLFTDMQACRGILSSIKRPFEKGRQICFCCGHGSKLRSGQECVPGNGVCAYGRRLSINTEMQKLLRQRNPHQV